MPAPGASSSPVVTQPLRTRWRVSHLRQSWEIPVGAPQRIQPRRRAARTAMRDVSCRSDYGSKRWARVGCEPSAPLTAKTLNARDLSSGPHGPTETPAQAACTPGFRRAQGTFRRRRRGHGERPTLALERSSPGAPDRRRGAEPFAVRGPLSRSGYRAAIDPSDRWRRSPPCHSSCRSARTAPTRRTTAASLGKTPTTRDRRLISLFSRSRGLVDQTFDQCALGKPVKASTSVLASSISGPILGKRSVSWSRTASQVLATVVASGWARSSGRPRRPCRRGSWGPGPAGCGRSGPGSVGAGSLEGPLEGGDQAGVLVGDDRPHPAQAALLQGGQEAAPEHLVRCRRRPGRGPPGRRWQ